jgi:hypothetical protein
MTTSKRTTDNTHAPTPCLEQCVRDSQTWATMHAVGLTRRPDVGDVVEPKHGSAASGTVIGLGQQVDGLRLGDEVMVIPDKEPEADS